MKHLVDKVWNRGGKLILDGAFGIPDETPVANVRHVSTPRASTPVEVLRFARRDRP